MMKPATIVVADDQSVNRTLLAGLLSAGGHKVFEAPDGAAALELCHAQRPDLLITDILMPRMDGPELVRQLRAEPVTASVRVLFYGSSLVENEMHQLARLCGATGVLVSPATPEALSAAVMETLDTPPSQTLSFPASQKLIDDQLSALTVKLFRQTDESSLLNTQFCALIELGQRLFAGTQVERMLAEYCHEARRILRARYAALGILDNASGKLATDRKSVVYQWMGKEPAAAVL
jgi:two-component system, cell cycle sensor histidine kinase and response regulator CckA